MRILQISTNFRPGGIQRHVLDLTEYLRENGHTVILAGDHGAWEPRDAPDDFLHLELDKIASTGGSVVKRVSEILPVARSLRRQISRLNVDIVHVHETAPAIIARLATFGLGIPVVFTYHGSDPGRAASAARTARRCVDWTLSPSRISLDSLISQGLPENQTRVMGLGVHPLADTSPEKVAAFRKTHLGKNGKFLISSLSRLAHQKGIDMMIEVARKIKDQRDDIVFVVGGHGPFEDLVDSWAEVAGVSDTIKFLGPVSDVATVLAASDLYLLTSRWEALPISIVEAFRSGLPVIATDCGGVTELINDDVGRVLDVGDTNGIANAILEIFDNPDLRQQLSENALELSKQSRFTPKDVHQNFIDLYQEILGIQDTSEMETIKPLA